MDTCKSHTTEDSLELWKTKYQSREQTRKNSEVRRREEGQGCKGWLKSGGMDVSLPQMWLKIHLPTPTDLELWADVVFESSLCFQALASTEAGGVGGRRREAKEGTRWKRKKRRICPWPQPQHHPLPSPPLTPPSNDASDLESPDASVFHFCSCCSLGLN